MATKDRRSSWVSGWRNLLSALKFSNASVKSSLPVRNPIECISKSRQTKLTLPPSQVDLLPVELIRDITQYLSLSSVLSLSCTCRRLRQTIEVKVKDLDHLIDMKSFLKDPRESDDERRAISERLAFLYMLERDGKLSGSKAVCSGCKTTHNVSLFSSTALQQRPHQRLCMGREGRIWICPHRIWDHAQLREVEKQSWETAFMAQCACPNREVLISHPVTPSSTPTEEPLLIILYPVLAIPQGYTFHTASIKKALRALGVSICPHLKFGDPNILDAFHQGCPRLKLPWSQERCSPCTSRGLGSADEIGVSCDSCKIRVAFYPLNSDHNTTTLEARVSRSIAKSIESVTDPAWRASLYMPSDFERLRKEWQASSMSRSPHDGKQVGKKIGTTHRHIVWRLRNKIR